MVGFLRRGSLRSLVASHSMVRDLPDPWVCQTTPPPLLRLAAGQYPVQRGAHGPVLLVARQFLDKVAPFRLVDYVVAQDVEQGRASDRRPTISWAWPFGSTPRLVLNFVFGVREARTSTRSRRFPARPSPA